MITIVICLLLPLIFICVFFIVQLQMYTDMSQKYLHLQLLYIIIYLELVGPYVRKHMMLCLYTSGLVLGQRRNQHRLFNVSTANIKHLYNIPTMLHHRQRRWADIGPILYKWYTNVLCLLGRVAWYMILVTKCEGRAKKSNNITTKKMLKMK